MEENGYLLKQVFKADKMVLFWKCMPTYTSVAKDEKKTSSFKTGKDKLKDLLCSSVCGDSLLNRCCFTDFKTCILLQKNVRNSFMST